jgi:hypothetical protein
MMRRATNQLGYTGVYQRVHNCKVSGKQKHGGNYNPGSGAHLRPSGPGYTAHFGFHFFYVILGLFRPTYGFGCCYCFHVKAIYFQKYSGFALISARLR